MHATAQPTVADPDALFVGNYCVSFIDLLGQREALRNQTLLPYISSEADKQKLIETLRDSVGSIAALQKHADAMLESSAPNANSHLRAKLSPEQQAQWDEMPDTKITTQRWSDGLMSFACLGDQQVKCPLTGVFHLFNLASSLCFIGLASRRPIRGAIEIAWGVELNPGELYGAVVARAYELESEIAGYPRIVVGPEALKFLDLQCRNPNTDPVSLHNRKLATQCRDMIIQDTDGHWLLHYLGETFRQAISHSDHAELYGKARAFVIEQLQEHQQKQNTKLAFRYVHLLQYFDAHPFPPSIGRA